MVSLIVPQPEKKAPETASFSKSIYLQTGRGTPSLNKIQDGRHQEEDAGEVTLICQIFEGKCTQGNFVELFQSLKSETENSQRRAEQLEAEANEANTRAEKTEEHVRDNYS